VFNTFKQQEKKDDENISKQIKDAVIEATKKLKQQ